MERSMNNGYIMSKHETTAFSGEESSWTMYFEDFFEASSSKVDVGDCSSSFVSDAASFVATKKTLHVSKQEGSNKYEDMKKRTRNREIPFGRHHDLEDTASSPSRSPNVCNIMSLMDNNTSHGDYIVGDNTTINVRKNAMGNQSGLSVDLTKQGLCLVPLSIVNNFLGQ